ncbi:MgtC/SapB family protein [Candidatus Micrarchaeota archaeon]|nr:MgtC/SapB family protein [Candidatus Micrarchaeota archaeon]
MVFDFLSQAVLSLALGGLIGLERGRKNHVLGLRSFALTSFIGFLLAEVAKNDLITAIGFLGISGISIVYYYFKSKAGKTKTGITTTLMLPFTFLLGVMISQGLLVEAGFACIAAVYLLVEKNEVHKIVETVSKEEIIDLLIFAIITFIIYPLLPETPYSLGVIKIDIKFAWTIVVLITSISLIAHVLLKYLGNKALALASLIGGVVSSQATIAVFSEKIKDARIMSFIFAAASLGAVLADSALLAIIAPKFFYNILPLLIGFIVAAGIAAFLFKTNSFKKELYKIQKHRHPLSLSFIIEFSAIFLAVNIAINWAIANNPELVTVTSLLGGLIGSTAVIASLAQSSLQGQLTTSQLIVDVFLALTGSLIARTVIGSIALKKNLALIKTAAIMLVVSLIGLYVNLFIAKLA